MTFRAVAGSIGISLSLALLVGCGPGLTSKAAKAPSNDVFAALDDELAHSVTSTTTLTSAPMPASALKLMPWEDDAPVAEAPAFGATEPATATAAAAEPARDPAPQTWGGIDSTSILLTR